MAGGRALGTSKVEPFIERIGSYSIPVVESKCGLCRKIGDESGESEEARGAHGPRSSQSVRKALGLPRRLITCARVQTYTGTFTTPRQSLAILAV